MTIYVPQKWERRKGDEGGKGRKREKMMQKIKIREREGRGEGRDERREGRERERERAWFLHGKALVSVVVVNLMVSLISRPTAIRFAPTLLCLFGRPRRSLTLRLILPQLSPLSFATATAAATAAAEPMARIEIPAVSEEKQSREDFAVSSPETRRV